MLLIPSLTLKILQILVSTSLQPLYLSHLIRFPNHYFWWLFLTWIYVGLVPITVRPHCRFLPPLHAFYLEMHFKPRQVNKIEISWQKISFGKVKCMYVPDALLWQLTVSPVALNTPILIHHTQYTILNTQNIIAFPEPSFSGFSPGNAPDSW